MDFHWLTDDHLHALIEAVNETKEPYKSRLRDVLLAMREVHTETLGHVVADAVGENYPAFDTDEDLALVQMLFQKGLMHNGIVPTMTIPQVARAADLVAVVIARMRMGYLSFDDQALLDFVFDQGANAYEQEHYQPVRRLERYVRTALGLPERLAFSPNLPYDIS